MFDRLLVFLASHPRVLPERVVRGLFLLAADAVWLCRAGSVRQLERNLAHVIAWGDAMREGGEPDARAVDRKRLRTVSRQGMRSYFTYFSEAMTVGARTEDQLAARIRGDGDGLDAAIEILGREDGRATIALGHQGNWDYDGFWGSRTLAPVTTVAERLGDERLLETFVRIRERLGIDILLTGTPHLTRRLEAILKGSRVVLPLLADRDLGRNGEFVRAFGSTIRVARGPATLAYDTGSPLFVANTFREPLDGERGRRAGTSHGYVCRVSGPVDVDAYRALPREQAIHAISQAWVDVWARGIADAPQDWHMLQPIFLEDLDLERLRDVPSAVMAEARALHGTRE